MLIFDIQPNFLTQLAIVGLKQVFEVVVCAFGDAFGVMLNAVFDMVLEEFLQLEGVVEVCGRSSDGSEVILDGCVNSIFAFCAAVDGGKIAFFDREFFQNMGSDVLLKSFWVFVFNFKLHVF